MEETEYEREDAFDESVRCVGFGKTGSERVAGRAGWCAFCITHECSGSAALLLNSKLPFGYCGILLILLSRFGIHHSPSIFRVTLFSVLHCRAFLCRLGRGVKREFYSVGGMLKNSWSYLCVCSRWRLQ